MSRQSGLPAIGQKIGSVNRKMTTCPTADGIEIWAFLPKDRIYSLRTNLQNRTKLDRDWTERQEREVMSLNMKRAVVCKTAVTAGCIIALVAYYLEFSGPRMEGEVASAARAAEKNQLTSA